MKASINILVIFLFCTIISVHSFIPCSKLVFKVKTHRSFINLSSSNNEIKSNEINQLPLNKIDKQTSTIGASVLGFIFGVYISHGDVLSTVITTLLFNYMSTRSNIISYPLRYIGNGIGYIVQDVLFKNTHGFVSFFDSLYVRIVNKRRRREALDEENKQHIQNREEYPSSPSTINNNTGRSKIYHLSNNKVATYQQLLDAIPTTRTIESIKRELDAKRATIPDTTTVSTTPSSSDVTKAETLMSSYLPSITTTAPSRTYTSTATTTPSTATVTTIVDSPPPIYTEPKLVEITESLAAASLSHTPTIQPAVDVTLSPLTPTPSLTATRGDTESAVDTTVTSDTPSTTTPSRPSYANLKMYEYSDGSDLLPAKAVFSAFPYSYQVTEYIHQGPDLSFPVTTTFPSPSIPGTGVLIGASTTSEASVAPILSDESTACNFHIQSNVFTSDVDDDGIKVDDVSATTTPIISEIISTEAISIAPHIDSAIDSSITTLNPDNDILPDVQPAVVLENVVGEPFETDGKMFDNDLLLPTVSSQEVLVYNKPSDPLEAIQSDHTSLLTAIASPDEGEEVRAVSVSSKESESAVIATQGIVSNEIKSSSSDPYSVPFTSVMVDASNIDVDKADTTGLQPVEASRPRDIRTEDSVCVSIVKDPTSDYVSLALEGTATEPFIPLPSLPTVPLALTEQFVEEFQDDSPSEPVTTLISSTTAAIDTLGDIPDKTAVEPLLASQKPPTPTLAAVGLDEELQPGPVAALEATTGSDPAALTEVPSSASATPTPHSRKHPHRSHHHSNTPSRSSSSPTIPAAPTNQEKSLDMGLWEKWGADINWDRLRNGGNDIMASLQGSHIVTDKSPSRPSTKSASPATTKDNKNEERSVKWQYSADREFLQRSDQRAGPPVKHQDARPADASFHRPLQTTAKSFKWDSLLPSFPSSSSKQRTVSISDTQPSPPTTQPISQSHSHHRPRERNQHPTASTSTSSTTTNTSTQRRPTSLRADDSTESEPSHRDWYEAVVKRIDRAQHNNSNEINK